MHLTAFSDYALRTVLFLGVHDDRLVPIAEIARAYGISRHHLVKVSHFLARLEVIDSVRGRRGGLRLAMPTSHINVGWLVRHTEPHFHLVECFNAEANTCPITPACFLRDVFTEAQHSFLHALDRYSLADLLASPERRSALRRLWAPAHDADGQPESA